MKNAKILAVITHTRVMFNLTKNNKSRDRKKICCFCNMQK